MGNLYQTIVDTLPADNVLIKRFGIDTQFEAVARISADVDAGRWNGYLIFKDIRFSPIDPAFNQMLVQMRYYLHGGIDSEQIITEAEEHWRDLCAIFASLRKSEE